MYNLISRVKQLRAVILFLIAFWVVVMILCYVVAILLVPQSSEQEEINFILASGKVVGAFIISIFSLGGWYLTIEKYVKRTLETKQSS